MRSTSRVELLLQFADLGSHGDYLRMVFSLA